MAPQTNMGLSICRSIIAAHRGRLWDAPELPHEATFDFTLLSHRERMRRDRASNIA
jgi:signal transduction histidine kinase